MNRKSIFSITALAASTALLLSGCAPQLDEAGVSVNVIPLSEEVKVSSFPNWSDSIVSILEADGWTVKKIEPNGPQVDNKNWPTFFSAQNKEGNCTFNLGLDAQYRTLTGNDEEYETRDYMLLTTKNNGSTVGEESTWNVNVNDKSKALQLMLMDYTYPNKVYNSDIVIDPNNPTPPVAVEATEDGKVYGVLAARVLSSENENPFYIANPEIEKAQASGAKLPPDYIGKTVRPVVSIKYECVKQEIDMKIWDKAVNGSILKMNITSTSKPTEK